MFLQIALGTLLMLVTIVIGGLSLWGLEYVLERAGGWLRREPHRPKMMLVLCVAATWAMWSVTMAVWIWALTLWGLGIFIHLETSVYFSLVAFTTLGFGDLLLPQEWRLLAGMAAANGLLNFGLVTATLIEALRHVRSGQIEARRRKP
ncbi:ion channel [Acidimangrovimonas sediminis]|uniref:ion channel n=1 Tax=Acidimangrovimonas sediminis TaxID=2056283 RepID=UPI000C7F8F9E|nr:ion channel [Acidimangrovimonas sediminis]